MNYNQNSGYGQAMLTKLIGATTGRTFVVMDTTDGDRDKIQQLLKTDEYGQPRFYSTLAGAYAAADSNRNDVIILGAQGTHELDTMLTVSKSRVHFIGLDYLLSGGRETAQRSKVQLSTTGNAAAVAATISNSGAGNTYRGLKIMNSGTDAASVAAFIDSGEATLIEYSSIMKFTDLDQATVADFICRADSYTYKNVEFGFDTLVQTAARPTFKYLKDGSTRAKHGRVIDCIFTCASSEATKVHVSVADTSSLAFENIFIRPIFINALVSSASAAALTNAVASASGLVEGNIFMVNPASNSTNLCAGTTDQIQVSGPVSSQQAGEAVTPA